MPRRDLAGLISAHLAGARCGPEAEERRSRGFMSSSKQLSREQTQEFLAWLREQAEESVLALAFRRADGRCRLGPEEAMA